jgi:MFS family permease
MPLLSLVIIFYLNFVSRVIYVPLLPIIEAELGIGHGEVGALFLFIAGGYCIGLLGSGFASFRIKPRWTIIFSTLAVCFFPAGFAMVSLIFPSYLRNLAVSMIMIIGFILGWGAIPPGIGYVADRFSFSLGFVFLGALTFVTLPLFLCPKTRVNGDRQEW